jgi:transglutaminase-like putative cysteine protease
MKPLQVLLVIPLCVVLCPTSSYGLAEPDLERYRALYPDANLVGLDESTSYDVEADGTYEYEHYVRTLVLTKTGVDHASSYQTAYYKLYDSVQVQSAQVNHPDGTVTRVDEDNIKDMPMPAFGPFYLDNVRLVIVTFPNLSPGDVTEVRVSGTRRSPPMRDAFWEVLPLRTFIPQLQKRLTIRLPADMPVRWNVFRGQLACEESEEDRKRVMTWDIRDAPQVIYEAGMPSFLEVVPVLVVTTIDSWESISRWYHGVCTERADVTEGVKQAVIEATAGASSVEDKIRGSFYWVSQNIRYVETTMTGEKAGFAPEPPDVTVRNRYGVCRDKAHLLTCMLKEIGVDAATTLIMAGTKTDVELPLPFFNHAITAVRNADGTWYFLDPTAEDLKCFLPDMDQDKWGLVCTAEGQDIQLTPLAPPEENLYHVAVESSLDDEGTLMGTARFRMTGMSDLWSRKMLKRRPPIEREEMIRSMVRAISPRAEVVTWELSDLEDLYTDLSASVEFRAPGYAIAAGDYLVLPVASQRADFDFLFYRRFYGTNLVERNYPLHIGSSFLTLIEERFEVPEGYEVRSVPEPRLVRSDGVSLEFTSDQEENTFTFREEMRGTRTYFSGSDFEDLVSMLAVRERLGEGKIICAR